MDQKTAELIQQAKARMKAVGVHWLTAIQWVATNESKGDAEEEKRLKLLLERDWDKRPKKFKLSPDVVPLCQPDMFDRKPNLPQKSKPRRNTAQSSGKVADGTLLLNF